MAPEHLKILQHALGADEYGLLPKQGSERNYYGTDSGECAELVSLGYMVQMQRVTWIPHDMFRVTGAGRKAMQECSPQRPKISASKMRFREYLNFSDAYECTFREWLDIRKTEWYRSMREPS